MKQCMNPIFFTLIEALGLVTVCHTSQNTIEREK